MVNAHTHNIYSASYYELSYDGSFPEQQKSSGLLIYTGTGSTSWAYNVNKITADEVQRLFEIARGEGLSLPQNTSLNNMAAKVTEVYNMSNVFSGSKQKMAFTVREPIIRGSVRNVNVNGMMVWSSSTRKPVGILLDYTVHAGLEKVPKYGVQSSKKKPCDL